MAAPAVLFLSGPNLTLLGVRQPEIYGSATLAEHLARAKAQADAHGLSFETVQADHEADLVAAVHGARDRVAGIVVNAGALSHYGWSLRDALASFAGPIVELHISNPDAREAWRHTSVLSEVASGSIAGFGGLGYALAVDALAELITATRG